MTSSTHRTKRGHTNACLLGIACSVALFLFSVTAVHAQRTASTDSLVSAERTDSTFSLDSTDRLSRADLLTQRTPRGALKRAAAFPGWGQAYNRQYVKLPFVYGALGGLIYSAWTSNSDYKLYREAFQYKAFQERVDSGLISENPRLSFKGSYETIAAEFGAISSRPLEAERNNLRRSRDFSLIGIGLVYSLAMLDAYVSAHLLDFDVGEDLNVSFSPYAGGFRLKALVPLERRAHRGLSN